MTVYYSYTPNVPYIPEEDGIYVYADFRGDNQAQVEYKQYKSDGTQIGEKTTINEQIVINEEIHEPIKMDEEAAKLSFDFTSFDGEAPQIHVYTFKRDNEEIKYLNNKNGGNIAQLLIDEENDEKNFESFINKVVSGTANATIDFSDLIAEGYSFLIEINFEDPTYKDQAHVLTWSNYAQSGWGDDAQIVGGKAKIVEAYMPEYDGEGNVTGYTKIYDIKTAEKGYGKNAEKFTYGEKMTYEWERGDMYPFAVLQSDDGGEVEAIKGVKVVYEFTPNYGNQLVRVGLGENGVAKDNPKYYEFIMPANHSHFNAEFKAIENEALVSNDTLVSNMTYTLDNEAIDSGTAVLSIDKVDNLTNEQKEGFAEEAGVLYEVATYLDVDLTQVWFKGKEAVFNGETGYPDQDVWTNEIYDLGNKKATITITLDEGVSPEDVIILHELHDDLGAVTGYETVTIVNKEKNAQGIWTITFETSKFSNYAIAEKKDVDIEYVPAKAATCKEKGNKAYYINHDNGKYYSDEECKNEITLESTVIEKIAHTYKTTTTKATLSKNGSIITKCSACGDVKSTTAIPYPKTIKLSATSYKYTGKVRKPSVTVTGSDGKTIASSNYTVTYSNKNSTKVGEYTVTIKFKGNYEGTKPLKYTINPKGSSIKKLTATKKGFKVTWNKNTTQTSGYQIEYATDSKFTKNEKKVTVSGNKNTSKSISNLKTKKKYYVRIRTYKTINGKRFYSSWSDAKTVKTK